jgi:hypothetical protein
MLQPSVQFFLRCMGSGRNFQSTISVRICRAVQMAVMPESFAYPVPSPAHRHWAFANRSLRWVSQIPAQYLPRRYRDLPQARQTAAALCEEMGRSFENENQRSNAIDAALKPIFPRWIHQHIGLAFGLVDRARVLSYARTSGRLHLLHATPICKSPAITNFTSKSCSPRNTGHRILLPAPPRF